MFVSIAIPEVAVISHRQAGVIGVDINADRLAVTETESGWKLGDPLRHLRAHERAESRNHRGCRVN